MHDQRSTAEGTESLGLRPGELPIFAPSGLRSRRWPVCSLGRFRDGKFAIHFRIHRRRGDEWVMTHNGASFTLPELRRIIAVIDRLVAEMPELAAQDERQTEGGR